MYKVNKFRGKLYIYRNYLWVASKAGKSFNLIKLRSALLEMNSLSLPVT